MVRKFVIPLVAASFILVGAAQAQPGPGDGPPRGGPDMECDGGPGMMGMGGHHGRVPGMMPAFVEGKLAFFKSWLGITDAQSGPWNTFADTVRAQAKSMDEMRQKASGPDQKDMNLPARLDRRIEKSEARAAALKKIKPSLDALYQALTPEQKQKADQAFNMR